MGTIQQHLSGSRIKAQYVQGEDGSKHFVGWYDTKLKVNCGWTRPHGRIPGTATNSKQRYCTSGLAFDIAELWSRPRGGFYFTDSSCTRAIVAQSCHNYANKLPGFKQFILAPTKREPVAPTQCVPNPLPTNYTTKYTCYTTAELKSPPSKLYEKSGAFGECKESKKDPKELFVNKDRWFIADKPDCTEKDVYAQFVKGELKTE